VSNTNLTIDMITKEAMKIAHETATFLGTVDRQYDESFGKAGGKIGSTLRVRKPNEYEVTTGRAIQVQDTEEQKVDLTMATQKHVAMRFNSAELYTDIDDFSRRYIRPAVSRLISDVESDVLQGVTKDVWNVVGSANTAINSLSVPGLARARLNQCLAPKGMGERSIQMDSVTMASLVTGLASLFQDDKQLKKQYREGMVGRTAMADYYENERVWTLPNAADVATTLDTYTVVDGDTDITVATLSAAPVEGMVFTIAGVYDCHPETKAAYPHLKQFVVTSATTTVINFQPAIKLSGARQNVVNSTGGTAAPSTTAAVAFVGDASGSYVQPIMYHKDAFAFVTGDLPLMAGADRCVRQTHEGISLRVWTDSDIKSDEQLTRIDILYGYAALRPEWACRMIGAKNS
jgi:hypothetical protein